MDYQINAERLGLVDYAETDSENEDSDSNMEVKEQEYLEIKNSEKMPNTSRCSSQINLCSKNEREFIENTNHEPHDLEKSKLNYKGCQHQNHKNFSDLSISENSIKKKTCDQSNLQDTSIVPRSICSYESKNYESKRRKLDYG